MNVALSRRLAQAFELATADERGRLVEAVQGAAGFDDLPDWARQLIEQLEARLAQQRFQERMDGDYQPDILREPGAE